MNNGKKIAGRIKSETEEIVTLMPNPFDESYTVDLIKSDIDKRELSPFITNALRPIKPVEPKRD